MKNLLKKIAAVRDSVGPVCKDGQNQFHKYRYVTHNAVLHEVREKLKEQGLVIVPKGIQDREFTKNGGEVMHGNAKYIIYDTESAESMEMSVACAGEDKGDKGAYKANTGAMKYLFIQLFQLPTDDDPENDIKYPAQNGTMEVSRDDSNKPWLNHGTPEYQKVLKAYLDGYELKDVRKKYKVSKAVAAQLERDASTITAAPLNN